MSSIPGFDYKGVPIWQRLAEQDLRGRPWQPSAWMEQWRRGEPLKDLLILDGHAHLGEWPGFFVNDGHAAGMLKVMDRIGMRAALIAPNAAMRSDQDYGNALTLQAISDYPGRFYGYVVANPYYAEEMEAMLNYYLDQPGMVGIKLHPEVHDDYPLLGPRYLPVWKAATERRVPVLFHTYFGGDSLGDIAHLAEKYPAVPMLVGHMLQDKSLEAMAELANTCPNVYVDLTVPETFGVTEFFVAALDDIRKIIFGTDFPWGNCHFRVGALLCARISDEQKRKILGENLVGLLKLKL